MTDVYFFPASRTKRAAATRPFTIDFKAWLRQYWIPERAYTAGSKVRSPTVSGFAFVATADGEAGAFEPQWPRVVGGTCTDGSLTWIAELPGTDALDEIQTVAWSQVGPPDNALTISNPVNTNEEASATFAGGTASSKYRVQCSVTTVGGYIYPVQFDLQIES